MAEDLEILKLRPSDNLGLNLVSTPLDGSNYLSWSRLAKITLGAKVKLSFINGEGVRPKENWKEPEQWIRADYMVLSAHHHPKIKPKKASTGVFYCEHVHKKIRELDLIKLPKTM
ncbi:UNVERIFIED_CONTAM: hypothetical protein Sindi_0859700 [Sesamum indicum]